MRLRGIGSVILAGSLVLASALASAQNSQQNSQQNGQQGNGTAPPPNNVPYTPPKVPSSDASGSGYGNNRPLGGNGSSGEYGNGGGDGLGGLGAGSNGSSGGGYGTGQNGTTGGLGRIGNNNPLAEDTPQNQQQMEQQQRRARNAERQKQLIADTQKLVALATELQGEVDKSTKDMLSLDVVRKADEIDKLARSVRDRMKNAN